jgi:hypothetical protein
MTGSKASPELVSGPIGTSGDEETSPDLLKNTPSNIARLEDEIEHCKGRQKYLAHTRSPSDGGDVRWYFCKVPLAENGEFFLLINLAAIFFNKLACLIPKCLIRLLRGGKVKNFKVSLPFSVMFDAFIAFICVSSCIMYLIHYWERSANYRTSNCFYLFGLFNGFFFLSLSFDII